MDVCRLKKACNDSWWKGAKVDNNGINEKKEVENLIERMGLIEMKNKILKVVKAWPKKNCRTNIDFYFTLWTYNISVQFSMYLNVSTFDSILKLFSSKSYFKRRVLSVWTTTTRVKYNNDYNDDNDIDNDDNINIYDHININNH